MKSFEKLLDILCVITTLIFFLASAVMVFGQAIAVVTLNGDLSVSLSNLISQRAGMVSAVTVVIALILAYMRGQMKES